MYSLLSALLFAAGVLQAQAQTPPGSHPSTNYNIVVKYGNTSVTPNVLLPENLVAHEPTVYLNQTLNGTHMVMLVDLAIPQGSINTTGPQVYPGLVPCRTTRLHWLQTGLTQAVNGTFVSNTTAIADYGGPMPGLDDIPHTYTFYLFPQPANFSLPAWDAGRVYNPISTYARMNFSVQAIADVFGSPIAANYIRVENPNTTAPGTASNGTCPTGVANGSASAPAPYTGTASGMREMSSLMLTVCGCAAFILMWAF